MIKKKMAILKAVSFIVWVINISHLYRNALTQQDNMWIDYWDQFKSRKSIEFSSSGVVFRFVLYLTWKFHFPKIKVYLLLPLLVLTLRFVGRLESGVFRLAARSERHTHFPVIRCRLVWSTKLSCKITCIPMAIAHFHVIFSTVTGAREIEEIERQFNSMIVISMNEPNAFNGIIIGQGIVVTSQGSSFRLQ